MKELQNIRKGLGYGGSAELTELAAGVNDLNAAVRELQESQEERYRQFRTLGRMGAAADIMAAREAAPRSYTVAELRALYSLWESDQDNYQGRTFLDWLESIQ